MVEEASIEHPDEEPERDQTRSQRGHAADRQIEKLLGLRVRKSGQHQHGGTGNCDDAEQKRKLGGGKWGYA